MNYLGTQKDLLNRDAEFQEHIRTAASDRERKILEMALLEEKLRKSRLDDYREMVTALEGQKEKIQTLLNGVTVFVAPTES